MYPTGNSHNFRSTQSAVEYAECLSAEGVKPHPSECPIYDTKNYLIVQLQL